RDQLRRWQDGLLKPEEVRQLEAHLDACRDVCQPLLGNLAADTAAPASSGAGGPAPLAIPPGYEVQGELGRGSFGVVYQATQTALKRVVALKMVLAGGPAAEERVRRFQAEA